MTEYVIGASAVAGQENPFDAVFFFYSELLISLAHSLFFQARWEIQFH